LNNDINIGNIRPDQITDGTVFW